LTLGRGNYSRHVPKTTQRETGSSRSQTASGSDQTILRVEELTNDESTWTNPVRANEDDELVLAKHYVPKLCNSYVNENQGGETEVRLSAGGRRFIADNVTPDGGLVENKAALVSSGARLQLWTYQSYLDENGGSLTYNFFRSPAGSRVGPTPQFASMLAATNYNVKVNYYDYDWWEELQ
jgi:hypothetical protein